jgi:hypothetical protein
MKYCLFIDESGDHGLVNLDPGFPVFLLCGVLLSQEDYSRFQSGFGGLKNHFFGSEASPYSYLPRSRAGLTNTAEGMLDLINEIHHAVYDDGDITFVLFNGCPVIIFACQHEADFTDKVVKAFSHASDRRKSYTVEAVEDSISEFVDRLRDYFEKEMRRHFITTTSIYGVEFAKDLYSEYSGYDKLDIEQCLQEAKELKMRRGERGV